ncbi:hypothetical protein CONLIGDRAFT_268781 [Coniochaeta ligniaria NRRL 30616]|uniref:BZIP domain-containing protein n=1 Tax=Coniochaeta ligniaria NRRL 30616 TaxID=1408157 RepID=A0A1J7JSS4_9PEZI|nr:hypothetical protein CONLIGDRAFT_268781 [Coniochaeta ligniaria NRRL 30616]
MMQAGVPPHSEGGGVMGGPLHPSSSVSPSMESADMGDVVMADGRKAKRELSQSKRAAQNRAAQGPQRAFRQRKELYIKKLEQEVRDYQEMENNFKATQTENYALRQYVISLQSRLLDAHGEYPQPPPGLSLAPHHGHGGPPTAAPSNAEPAQAAPATPGNGTSLEVVAQAVGLARGDPQAGLPSHPGRGMKADPGGNDDDSRADEEIGRQLQADGSLPSAPM